MNCKLEEGGRCGSNGGVNLGIRNTGSMPRIAYWTVTLHRGLDRHESNGETRIPPKAFAVIQCSRIGVDRYTLRLDSEAEG